MTLFKNITRALNHPNYRLFFTGQFFSLLGTWIQQVAVNWLVYRLTHSVFWLGVFNFSGQIPVLLFSPLSGVWIDRIGSRKILLYTQTFSLVQAFLLTLLYYGNQIEISYLISLNFLLGVLNSMDMPARHALVTEIVTDKNDVGNAVALNSLIFNSTRLIGPCIAGLLVAFSGEGICFIINTFSFLAIVICLLKMKIPEKIRLHHDKGIIEELKDGFIYVFSHKTIRTIIFLLALLSFLGIPYQTLLPAFVKEILRGDSRTLGYIMAFAGFGASVAAIFMAGKKNTLGLNKLIKIATLLFSLGILGLSLSSHFWVAALVVFILGFGMMIGISSMNTTLQLTSEEAYRGKVMSYYTLAFLGLAPFGSLLSGIIAHKIGLPLTFLISGLLCLGGSLALFPHLKNIQTYPPKTDIPPSSLP